MEKGGALYSNKLKSFSPKDALCQVWLKFSSGKEDEMWKVYDNGNDNDIDDGQPTTFDQKSSLDPSAQVS